MTAGTKIYIARLSFWLAAIVLVAWPLHLARPEIGDVAYVTIAAIVLGASYWLGAVVAKHMAKSHGERHP